MRRHDLDVRARSGRFRATGVRADQALLARIGPDRRRQHARDGSDRAVEPKFAEHGETGKRIGRNCADKALKGIAGKRLTYRSPTYSEQIPF